MSKILATVLTSQRPHPYNIVALIKLPLRKNSRGGKGQDYFAFRQIPHLTEMS